MSTPFEEDSPLESGNSQAGLNEKPTSVFDSNAADEDSSGDHSSESHSEDDISSDNIEMAPKQSLGRSLAAFVQTFSPLATSDTPSPLLKSSGHTTRASGDGKVSNDSGQVLHKPISFGSSSDPQPQSLHRRDSSGVHFSPDASASPYTAHSHSTAAQASQETDLPTHPLRAPPLRSTTLSNPLGGSTLFTASSAAAQSPSSASSGLFTALGSFFSKRAITGAFDVELGTSVKVDEDDAGEIPFDCHIDDEGYLSTRFEIDAVALSNVDQILVQKLMLLYRESQKRLPFQQQAASFASVLIPGSSLPTGAPANTSAPSLVSPPASSNSGPSSDQSVYLEGLTSSLATSGINLNSNMEKAVEWTLQARPLGYGYKGIGKLLRRIRLNTKPPHDLHLTHIPLFLHSVPQLEYLDMRHHSMTSLPVFTLFISSRLRKVILSNNKIKTLFTEVPLVQLAGLVPPGTPATYVSRMAEEGKACPRKTDLLEHLTSPLQYFASVEPSPIEYLDLSNNLISAIPPFIGNFKELSSLNLAYNQLYSLPSEISTLPLTDLNIDSNHISELPSLPKLLRLSWKANGLKAGMLTLNPRGIISSLSHAPSLVELDISGNSFDQVPLSIVQLAPTLQKLSMASTGLTTLVGTEMAKFTSLSYLDISSNRLKSIPSEIITSSPLQHLDLSDNQLSTLPTPLNPLGATLVYLNLSKNALKSIPIRLPHEAEQLEGIYIKHTDIQQLSRLEHLDLSSNRFADLPDMFEELSGTLTYLDISNNLIVALPASSGALSSLQYLHATNNKLEAVSPLGLMRGLEYIDLQGNDTLVSLPRSFVELRKLKDLLVGHMKMSRSLNTNSATWKYDTQPLKPISDKLFVDRLPQLLQLTRSSAHSLLLSAVHLLCKHPQFHETIMSHNLLYTLLSSAKCVTLSHDYEDCFNFGQEQISTMIAIRYLAKNMEMRERFESDARPLITIISEHITKQASTSDTKDPDLYDAEGRQLGKSTGSTHRLDELGRAPSNEFTPTDSDSHSNHSSSSISHSGSHHGGGHWGSTPRASRAVQLHRLQNKIRISVTGLCLDIACYLSWTQPLRTVMNSTDRLVDSIKTLKDHVDEEVSERARRTLAGLGVAPVFKEKRGVRVLTLDGGGTRGFTAVVMLRRLEEKLGRPIHEFFDLMVGTSTGALIATLAAWTRLTMAEAVVYYREACGIIFAPRGTGVMESKYTAPVSEAPQPNTTQGAKIFSLAYELEPETFLKFTRPKVRQAIQKGKQVLRLSAATVPLLDPSVASTSAAAPGSGKKNTSKRANGLESDAEDPPENADTSTDGGSSGSAAHPAGISATWTGLSPWARLGGFFGMIASRSFYDTAALEIVLKNLGDHQAIMLDTAANGDLRIIFTATDVGVFPPQSYLLRNYAYKDDSQSKYGGCCHIKMWEAMRCTTAAPAYFDAYTVNGHRLADGGISTNNPTGIAIQEAKALWPEKKLDVVLSVGVGLKPTRPCASSMSATFGAIIEGCTETEQTHALVEDLLPKDVYFRLQPVDDVYDFPLDETKIEKLDAALAVLNVWMDENDDYFNRIVAALSANRTFDDDEEGENGAPLSKSESWADHHHHRSRSYMFSSASHHHYGDEHDSDDETTPSPLRPIASRVTIMDKYSPLDDLQQWEDED